MAAHRRGRSPGRRGTIGRYAAAAIGVLSSLVAGTVTASADVQVVFEETRLVLGDTYHFGGTNWYTSATCGITLAPTGHDVRGVGSCEIDASGALTGSFTVPADVPLGSAVLGVAAACPPLINVQPDSEAFATHCTWTKTVEIVATPPPPGPSIDLEPTSGPPATVVKVSGSGFGPPPCGIEVLGSAGRCTVTEGGVVEGEVTIPLDASVGATDIVVCTGCDVPPVVFTPQFVATASFTVTAPRPGYDLAITTAVARSSDRGEIVVEATIANLGEDDSPDATVVAEVDGWVTTEETVAALHSAGELTVELTLPPGERATPGRHVVTVGLAHPRPDADADAGNDARDVEVVVPDAAPPDETGPTVSGGDSTTVPTDDTGGGDEPASDPTVSVSSEPPTGPPTTAVDGEPIAAGDDDPAVVPALAVFGLAAAVVAGSLLHRRRARRLPSGSVPLAIPETVAASTGARPALSPTSGRRVRLDIAAGESTPRPHDPRRTLVAGAVYHLGVHVAPPASGAPPGTPLMARVFAAAGVEVRTTTKGGAVEIGAPGDADPASFPFTVAKGARRFALRCNLYCNGTLVQARLVTGRVRGRLPRRGGIRSVVDYTLVPSLDDGRLSALRPTDLSVLVNRATPGTVQVYAAGGSFAGATSLDAGAVEDAVSMMRRALHTTAWGDDSEWALGKLDRYDPRVADEATRRERLRRDLVAMAKTGYDLYDAVIAHLARGAGAADELTELVRRPPYVEVAHKVSPRLVLPAALLYDHPLDATLPVDDYDLCPSFVAGQDGDGPLDDVGCFQGRCPAHGDLETVCPSGFWGFRHYLGTPVSVADGPDAPDVVEFDGGPTLAVAVSTALELRAAHEEALRALVPPERWRYADDRDAALEVLRRGGAQVAYFYCHGGLSGRGVPYIQVGPGDGRGITRSLLRAKKLRWTDPRPLVVLNGCHTAALTPSKAIDLVSGFVDTANASGVLGTEVTVFEPLAGAFAVELLRRLFAGEELGPAVRGARLALLRTGNPLGLVYVTYASPQLRLAPRPGAEVVAAEVVAGGVV